MILSTLAEIDTNEEEAKQKLPEKKETSPKKDAQSSKEKASKAKPVQEPTKELSVSEEKMFLSSIRERILVLFEGLQSPKNENLDTKMDITLNFLEFLLASIDKRLQKVR